MLQKTYTENERSKDFWENFDEYHEMVRTYYRGLEIESPDYVTSRGACGCINIGICSYCGWGASNVTYMSNNGESI